MLVLVLVLVLVFGSLFFLTIRKSRRVLAAAPFPDVLFWRERFESCRERYRRQS